MYNLLQQIEMKRIFIFQFNFDHFVILPSTVHHYSQLYLGIMITLFISKQIKWKDKVIQKLILFAYIPVQKCISNCCRRKSSWNLMSLAYFYKYDMRVTTFYVILCIIKKLFFPFFEIISSKKLDVWVRLYIYFEHIHLIIYRLHAYMNDQKRKIPI